ncbi:hypothetical protein SteCoe_18358 [Stentor coeruleus]|uniref:Uncharacterized protein n=1 Tax=Stentor coeruleus TaxID=5963 RepID=A0A1R2BWT7_9CILI|nr:hypothetical protein SteCoe_18358 [Stentor coeruleus]
MSLCYHSEHLAWQQRVNQERSRANNFYKTTGSFFHSPVPISRSPFPNSNQDIDPKNYKTLDYSLAYTFGGTKPIRHAHLDPAKKKALQIQRSASSNSRGDCKKGKNSMSNYRKRYIDELKEQIERERLKREEIHRKIVALK